ncbi:hypothetical protein [Micromonospora sp. WMMD998]|uniref:hypothetical protein n=1 Tax=Micromonospora sp. WMMD998 TaxID=3016092 RepID=UPI00249B22E4|nr:hypothetical protein [Micromonospora sp. WMMD998]WFE40922.1 hypothetical protein O7619_21645 [Micromonospora sp. WMMD998]
MRQPEDQFLHLRRVRVLGDLHHGRIPAGAVYIGRAAPGLRANPYANPHRAGICRSEQDQADAVTAYAVDSTGNRTWPPPHAATLPASTSSVGAPRELSAVRAVAIMNKNLQIG